LVSCPVSTIYNEAYNESNPKAICPIGVSNVATTCNLSGRPLAGCIHNFTNARYYLFNQVTGSLPTYNLVAGEAGDPLTFGITLRAKFN
jgi:hypothetical protein